MRIILDDLPVGGSRYAGTAAVRVGSGVGADEVDASRPVAFGLWAIRDGSELHVQGWLSTTVEVTCARCAERFPHYLRRHFELVYKRSGPEDAELRLDERDLDLDYYRDEAVDLRTLLAEQLLLALPMKILCRPECLGLCPQCGTNRNRESCSCSPYADPRLASLAAIRDQL